MGIAITSIGVKIAYAVETTAGTRPTTGYIHIPDLKSFPAIDSEPNTADATTFDNLEYTSYVALLKDLGGALELTGNMTDEIKAVWKTMCESHTTAIAEGKMTWMSIDIPGIEEAGFIPITPAPMGLPQLEANALIEKSLYVTPIGEPVWDTKPTYAEGD